MAQTKEEMIRELAQHETPPRMKQTELKPPSPLILSRKLTKTVTFSQEVIAAELKKEQDERNAVISQRVGYLYNKLRQQPDFTFYQNLDMEILKIQTILSQNPNNETAKTKLVGLNADRIKLKQDLLHICWALFLRDYSNLSLKEPHQNDRLDRLVFMLDELDIPDHFWDISQFFGIRSKASLF